MSKKLIMIDGNSLVFRAFHALPPMKMSNGQVINAAYGFFNMLLGLIDEHHPDYLAVSFDLKGPTFRKEMFDAYKANRQKTPEELLTQFPLIKEALHTASAEMPKVVFPIANILNANPKSSKSVQYNSLCQLH